MNEKNLSLADVFEELAKLDPMIEGYQGHTSCYFCGARMERGGIVSHNMACLWFEAVQYTRGEQKIQGEHSHRFHAEDQTSIICIDCGLRVAKDDIENGNFRHLQPGGEVKD